MKLVLNGRRPGLEQSGVLFLLFFWLSTQPPCAVRISKGRTVLRTDRSAPLVLLIRPPVFHLAQFLLLGCCWLCADQHWVLVYAKVCLDTSYLARVSNPVVCLCSQLRLRRSAGQMIGRALAGWFGVKVAQVPCNAALVSHPV